MRRPDRASGIRRLLAVALGVALVSVLAPVEGATASGTATVALALPDAASQPSFAARAGYAPAVDSQVADLHAAAGLLPVDVVFDPAPAPSVAPDGWVSSARFAAEYGPSLSSYSQAAQYFRGYGIEVTHEWPDRLTLSLAGTAAELGRAFGTTLVAGTYGNRSVVYPSSPPALPSSIESLVAGVVGLSSGFVPFSISLAPVSASPAAPPGPDQTTQDEIYPAVARNIYGISSLYNLTGTANYPVNQSIALLLWGNGYDPNDISSFFNNYQGSGVPKPTVVPYTVDGAPLPNASAPSEPDKEAVEELTLDIEWAGSAAPGATLDAVYAPNGPSSGNYSPVASQITDAFEEALSLPNVSVISMSFGVGESGDQSLASSWNAYLVEAADRGITVVAASGDLGGGADSNCKGGSSIDYPASSPYVLAVGGTNVTLDYVAGVYSGFSETAWSDSAGGYSTQFGAPSWQEVGSAAAPVEASGHRGVPDVSASAADDFLYFDGSDMTAKGTSFAAPFWAGLVAAMDQQWDQSLGWIDPNLYHVGASQPSGQIGIGLAYTSGGGNCVATANGGWNAVTGWGSPRGIPLYEDLVGSYVNLSLAVTPSTVAPGGTISIVTQLANRTTGAPIANTEVRIAAVSDTAIGPCTGTFSTADPETNATGWARAQLSVPFCYLGAHANVTVIVTTDRLYGTNQLMVAVNLLGLYPPLEAIDQAPWSYVSYVGIMAAAIVIGGVIGRGGRRRPPDAAPVPDVGSAPRPGPTTSTPVAPVPAGPSPSSPTSAPGPTGSGTPGSPPPESPPKTTQTT
jgi:kumamolisin